MHLSWLSLIAIFALLIVILLWNFHHKRRGLPPGPTPLPLLGNLLDLARSRSGKADIFLQWRRRFGPIYTCWLSEIPVVCVADHQRMVDIFLRDGANFADRPRNFNFFVLGGRNAHVGDAGGILGSNGDEWREQRRFCAKVLHNLCFGKISRLQAHILGEIATTFQKLDADIGKDSESDLVASIDLAIGSTINAFLFGHRLDGAKECEFWHLKGLLTKFIHSFESPVVLFLLLHPALLAHFYPFREAKRELDVILEAVFDSFERKIREHQRKLDLVDSLEEKEPAQDFVDAFLREMASRERNAETGHYFSIQQLRINCLDLWAAGQITTALFAAWGLAHLLHCPEQMERLGQELDQVIGSDRLVTMADRPRLPFTNAVIQETLRVGSCVLLSNLPHAVASATELDGFRLPKGTWIVPQFPALFCDDKIFPEPERFNPGHFLDENGKMRRREELVPFSVGRRQCPGESLARMQLFLLFANLFNRYKLMPGKELPSLECRSATAILNQCQPFTCRLERRRQTLA